MKGKKKKKKIQHKISDSLKKQEENDDKFNDNETHPTTWRQPKLLYLCNSLPVRETKQTILILKGLQKICRKYIFLKQ